MTLLFSQGVGDGHDALGEALAAVALGAEALAAPLNETAEPLLGIPGLCRVGAFEVGRRSGASLRGAAGVFTDAA